MPYGSIISVMETKTETGIDTGTLTCAAKDGRKIVDGVRIEVPSGQAYGLLGRDSRAKRLIMRLAASNLKNARLIDDESMICGLPLPSGKAYVFDTDRLFSFMTCKEYLLYGGGGLKTDRQELMCRIDGLLELVSLNRRANRKISALSGAEYLCLCAAFSLLADAQEVLINADTLPYGKESRETLNRLISNLKKQGKAVLVNLSDPRMCGEAFDTVGIMSSGAIVLQGKPQQLAGGDPKTYFINGKGSIAELRAKFDEISRRYDVNIRGVRKPTLASVYRKAVKN